MKALNASSFPPITTEKIQIATLNVLKTEETIKSTKIVIDDFDENNGTTTSYSPPLYDSSTSNCCSSPSADSSEASTSYSEEKENNNNSCKNCFKKAEKERDVKKVNSSNSTHLVTTEWTIRPDAKWKVRSIGLLAAILPGKFFL